MTTAMKLTTGILAMALVVTAGAAFAQTPDAIDNARSTAKALQQGNGTSGSAAAKPAPGAPAPAIKPALIPGATTSQAPAAKTPKAAAATARIQLQHVNVVPVADGIRIEINASGAVTPRAINLDSPARIAVELPDTMDVTPKNHIAVGAAGVKGVRIGMNGQTPPTTSVVVDLENPTTFDLTPGPSDKLVLTVHGEVAAKSNPAPAPVKAAAPPQTTAKAAPAPAKAQPAPIAKSSAAAKPVDIELVSKTNPSSAKASGASPAAKKTANGAAAKQPEKQSIAKDVKPAPAPAPADATKISELAKPQPKPEDKKWAMNGKRDPFFSPVVQQPGGSGCSTGKKCLEIGNINLRGVVKSDSGFIAVVTNSLNKAYFLRENDPVFNGYVVKITGDSVVFSETVEDKLGKPFTREVVKRIFTPAV